MKIVNVIPYFTPQKGGDVASVYNLSKHLAKRGHEVTIFTTDFELDREYVQSLDGVRVVPFHCIANIGKMLISPEMSTQLKKEIKNFDIIHLHDFRSYQNIIAHHYAKKYEIPYILQVRGSLPRFKTKKRLKELFDIFFGYRILKDASKLIFTTKMELEKCEGDFDINKNKIEIVPNGIDLSEYDDLPKRGDFRKKYSIKAEEKIILYLGRIHEIKGLDMLVRAFADVIKRLEDVKLVIVGPDDGYIATLKAIVTNLKIDDKVLFTGPLFERDKLEAYVGADVFVLPSRYESLGNVVLEACACGTPVIVTNNCGASEWISDNVGYVVDYDEVKLQEAIFKVLRDEELGRRFGEEGKKLVMEKFGWNGIVRKMEELYEDCVHR